MIPHFINYFSFYFFNKLMTHMNNYFISYLFIVIWHSSVSIDEGQAAASQLYFHPDFD